MKPTRIRFMATATAVLVAASGFWWAQYQRTARAADAGATAPVSQPTNSAVQSVEVSRPQRQDMVRQLSVPGTIEAFEQADLYAKVSGYVSEMKVDIGDRVKTGQVLAVLDVPEMRMELTEAEAQVMARAAALEEAKAKIVQEQKMLELSRSQLRKQQSDLKLKEITFRRREELFKGQAVTEQDLDEARNQYETAQADAAIAQARIVAAEADVRSAEAARLVAEAQVNVAKAQVDRFKQLLDYARITAPFDGVVTRRLVDRGALIQSTTGLSTIQRIDQVRIFVEVPEPDIPWVRDGAVAKVTPYGWTRDPFHGTVARTSQSLNPQTRTMRTEIDVLNPDGRLLHGMYAQVQLNLEEKAHALTIPAAAVLTEAGKPFVFTVNDNTAQRTPIECGIDDGIRIEVKSGLRDGDLVVLAGRGLVTSGQAVRAVLKGGRNKPVRASE